ncbi:MAG: RbsD/FucU domain-containing protein [Planctomycetota bacterium]|jgi:D-ribose pyranose/furanose isomerase RbsD
MPFPTTTTRRDSFFKGRTFRCPAAACCARVAFVVLGLSAPALGTEPVRWAAKGLPAHLKAHVRLLGHRNWIVVADSAYPWQSRPGIQTVCVDQDHVEVVEEVLRAVDAAKHVRPLVCVDAELKSVPEEDAPGVDIYRKKLAALLRKRPVKTMPHEAVIANLDQAAETFRVLVIKTDMAIPYTTVFIQLECGYWSAKKEKRLRKAMGAKAR